MIAQMLSRSPSDRPNFDHILSAFRGPIFPEYFYTFLQDYTNSLNELAPATGTAYLQNAGYKPGNKIDRMSDEWDSILIHLEGTAPEDDPVEGKLDASHHDVLRTCHGYGVQLVWLLLLYGGSQQLDQLYCCSTW